MNRLIQLLTSNKPQNKPRIEASGDEATVYVYDAIGYWGVEAQDFVKEIDAIKAKTIHLRINSPGGDVFDARAMKTALENHSAHVIAHIDGLAASAASFLMLAADDIEIADGGFIMIHEPWGFSMGTASDMRATADLLDKVNDAIVNDYSKATGKEITQIRQWMSDETWFSASEALEHGFVGKISEKTKANNAFNLSAYKNLPAALAGPSAERNEPFSALDADRERMLARLTLIERTA